MDREKVIKGLECHADRTNLNCRPSKCPYFSFDFCGPLLANDALELLKEQEAVIELYHKADTFLATHGWSWEGR